MERDWRTHPALVKTKRAFGGLSPQVYHMIDKEERGRMASYEMKLNFQDGVDIIY